MRALLQRVNWANVVVAGSEVGAINQGLLIFLGVREGDTESDAQMLAHKISSLRIFEDEAGKMNWDLAQVNGAVLIVSQFTLYADWRKGRRPAFTQAAKPAAAEALYHYFCTFIKSLGVPVQCGQFGAPMMVSLQNDGPVTLMLQSERSPDDSFAKE